MMVGHRERFFHHEGHKEHEGEKSELRWYRGARRPHKRMRAFLFLVRLIRPWSRYIAMRLLDHRGS